MLPILPLLVAALAQPQPTPAPPAAPAPPPAAITVSADDTRITQSCVVVIPPGVVLLDGNKNGVLQVDADSITITFAPDSILVGADHGQAPDTYSGIGIALNGHKDVTIKNARVSGYKIGLQASSAPRLTIDGGDFSNNFRERLRSTPQSEAAEDWLYPHHNDAGEWLNNYGAAIAVKDSTAIVIHSVKIHQGQNGIVLDRVTQSRIFDNDCSFLSGWGLAMWRSGQNAIARNALDFCIRGYSHGVYNRGQDSAGLLMFEQCSGNLITENSVTHGGDGIFGFAGSEAIGDTPPPAPAADGKPFNYLRRGNNDNIIIANDLSDAAAHGLEMTFSFGNRVFQNTFANDGVCGIWGGYSQGTLIAENTFDHNGDMAYGLERGGINIEHGAGNMIFGNVFRDNKCGVRLWWDDDGDLLKKPGVAANNHDVTGNSVIGNSFSGDLVALELRDDSPQKDKVRGTVYANNKTAGVKEETRLTQGLTIDTTGEGPMYMIPKFRAIGEARPVGARKPLAGRQNIIMTEWGPWDHTGPLVRPLATSGAVHKYEFYNIDRTTVALVGPGINSELSASAPGEPFTITVRSPSAGLHPYAIRVNSPDFKQELRGSLLSISWDLAVFPWEGPAGPTPPQDLAKWRTQAQSPAAKHAKADTLSFNFGMGGPSQVDISPEITAASLPTNHFGLIATARVPLTKGRWRLRTVSDDGIRVLAGGKPLIENWTHHGATPDSADLTLDSDQTIDLTVEYFEIDGAAVLDVQIEPAR